ncbi:ATP-binding response regulator [Ideonella livida]|uniref:histidine kinase n=1 Tax=Ideonella livida TaxID=2707176 RepID=A0A7C9TI32_9BURK|nr:hybrid sensor histidine kinase/response regulator [Ideonella livida]NDY89963.1 hybrid sensor histidine kinase/response regulator [Ideonella livida]
MVQEILRRVHIPAVAQERLRETRLRMFIVQSRMGTTSAALAATFLGLLVAPSVGVGRFALWLMLLGVGFAVRGWVVRRLARRDTHNERDERWVTYSTVALALVVGMPAPMFMPQLDAELRALCTTVQVCWVVAGALILGLYWRAYQAYVGISFSLIAAGWILSAHWEIALPMTLLLLAASMVLVRFAQRLATMFEESVKIRYANEVLVGELTQALQDTEQAQQARSRFLAAASHDLLQPVHALMLLVGVLKDQRTPEAVEQTTRRLETTAGTVAAMFRGLFDQARLDAGAVAPQLTRVGVSALLRSIEDSNAPRCAAKGLALQVSCEPHLVVWADAGLLDRAVRNLVDNAIKYTPQGEVEVRAWGDEQRVHILVRDTGIGISQADQKLVCDPFFRGQEAKRSGVDGVGLGLAVAQQMVGLMDGTLALTSSCPGGTRITVSLQRALDGALVAEVPQPASPEQPALTGRRLLVVEDDVKVREALVLWLKGQGCQVCDAGCLADLLARCDPAHQAPDLVLSDQRLEPGPDGLTVIARLRERWPDLPAVLVSGESLSAEEVPEDVFFLQKPVSTPALLMVLKTMLDKGEEDERSDRIGGAPSPG